MGYRAHTIKQHRDYGATTFCDYGQFENYFDKLVELYSDEHTVCQAESQDYFEIDSGAVEKEIERLIAAGQVNEFEFQNTWGGTEKDTNGYIVSLWREMLEQSPKDCGYVALEWY